MTSPEHRACRHNNAVVAELVCCPSCWTWSPLGQRATCKKCGTPLVRADGRGVAVAETQEVAAAPPPSPPPVVSIAPPPPAMPIAPPAPPPLTEAPPPLADATSP